jgi:hypothetical protein
VVHTAHRLAVNERTTRVPAIVAVDDCLFGSARAFDSLAIRFRAADKPTLRSIFRRHDDFIVLTALGERGAARFRRREARKSVFDDRSREKFFVQSNFFCKNVLHNFSNFVQLRASDIGLHAFQTVAS